MIKILIHGIAGRMGREVYKMAKEDPDFVVVAGVDRSASTLAENEFDFPIFSKISEANVDYDVIIDFSLPEAIPDLLKQVKISGCGLVIATTGLSIGERALVEECAQYAKIFIATNMSLGVNLQSSLIKHAASAFGEEFDVEIIEKHHNQKIDAPSGTALTLAEAIMSEFEGGKYVVSDRSKTRHKRDKREIGVHSVRGGTVVGEHQVLFLGEDEVLEITHIAHSKKIFAKGALRAAKFLPLRTNGLYSMNEMLAEDNSVTKISAIKNQSIINIDSLNYISGEMADVFNLVSDINIDMINQTISYDSGVVDISFSLNSSDLELALSKLSHYKNLSHHSKLARLTIEGVGMQHKSGVAAGLFSAMRDNEIPLRLVTTSETVISICISEADIQRAIKATKNEFYSKAEN